MTSTELDDDDEGSFYSADEGDEDNQQKESENVVGRQKVRPKNLGPAAVTSSSAATTFSSTTKSQSKEKVGPSAGSAGPENLLGPFGDEAAARKKLGPSDHQTARDEKLGPSINDAAAMEKSGTPAAVDRDRKLSSRSDGSNVWPDELTPDIDEDQLVDDQLIYDVENVRRAVVEKPTKFLDIKGVVETPEVVEIPHPSPKKQILGLKLGLDEGLSVLPPDRPRKFSPELLENPEKLGPLNTLASKKPETASLNRQKSEKSDTTNDWSVDDWDVDIDSKSSSEESNNQKLLMKIDDTAEEEDSSEDSEENALMVTPASDRPITLGFEDRLMLPSVPDSRKISETSATFEKLDENLCQTEPETAEEPESQDLPDNSAKFFPSSRKNPTAAAEKPVSLWGGWNNWISAATDSITVLTNTVGEGFNSVLETMESTLGAPTPEELARLSIDERCQLRRKADQVKEPLPEDEKDDCDSVEEVLSDGGSDSNTARSDRDDLSSGYQSDSALFGVRRTAGDQQHHDDPHVAQEHQRHGLGGGSIFSNVSHVFETTGRTLVTGSLDVMETIGKKTFDVLTEPAITTCQSSIIGSGSTGQHQHQRRKLKFQPEKPSLSSVLREIRDKSSGPDDPDQQSTERKFSSGSESINQQHQTINYDRLFEKYQGSVNLEALEMLSENQRLQLNSLLRSISSDKISLLREQLEDLKASFDVAASNGDDSPAGDSANFETAFNKFWDKLLIFSYKIDRLLQTRRKHLLVIDQIREHQRNGDSEDDILLEPSKIYEYSVQYLAEYTAQIVEMFLKIGQLFMVEKHQPDVRSLSSITKLLAKDIDSFSSKYSLAMKASALNASSDMESLNTYLTNLFLEANNSSVCIRDAALLLLPVLQVLHVENSFQRL